MTSNVFMCYGSIFDYQNLAKVTIQFEMICIVVYVLCMDDNFRTLIHAMFCENKNLGTSQLVVLAGF